MSDLGPLDALPAATPDPGWSMAELLRAASAAKSLSAAWVLPLSVLDPAAMTSSQRVAWAVATNRLTAVVEELSLRAIASVPSQPCAPAGTGTGTGTGVGSAFPDENADPSDDHAGDGPGPCEGGLRCPHTWEVEELTALMRLSRGRIITRRQWGRDLVGRYACFAPLLTAGQTGLGHFILLSNQLQHCTETTATLVAEQVAGKAVRLNPQPFARAVSRALARCISPEEAAQRHARAVKDNSGVAFWPREDGLLGMGVTGSVEKIEALRAIFGTHPAINHPLQDDTRTKGERQVDFLLDACMHAATGLTNPAAARRHASPASPPSPAGQPTTRSEATVPPASATAAQPDGGTAGSYGDSTNTNTDTASDAEADPDGDGDMDLDVDFHNGTAAGNGSLGGEVAIGVVITASIETLEGLSNEPGMVGETVTDAATIRHLAADRRWGRGSLYDRRGINVNLGRKVRFPNKAQRIAVGVRNPRCVFPGCSRSAQGSEIDHNQAWEHGGRTDLANLYPLCTLHHHLKHQPGWTCKPRRDGSLLWTLPHGQQIVVAPPDYRVPAGPHDRTYTELELRQQEADDDAHHYAMLAWAIANDPENQEAA